MDFTGRQIYDAAVRCGGEVAGVLRDLLFDTKSWSVRYVVVEVGAWPSPQRILLEPAQVSAFTSLTAQAGISRVCRQFHRPPTTIAATTGQKRSSGA